MEKIPREIVKDIEMRIPVELFQQFKAQPRIVIRHPWIIGIPAPDQFIDPKILQQIKEANLEIFLVGK
jgi:hypothetical protein